MKRRVEIGGQDFDVLESFTVEQELYLAALIRRGRLDRIPFRPTDRHEAFAQRLLESLEQSRVGRAVLSVLLVPAGEPWSMDEAQKTAAHVKEWLGTIDDDTTDTLGLLILQALTDRGVIRASLEAGRTP
jgi:hypothetical protein